MIAEGEEEFTIILFFFGVVKEAVDEDSFTEAEEKEQEEVNSLFFSL